VCVCVYVCVRERVWREKKGVFKDWHYLLRFFVVWNLLTQIGTHASLFSLWPVWHHKNCRLRKKWNWIILTIVENEIFKTLCLTILISIPSNETANCCFNLRVFWGKYEKVQILAQVSFSSTKIISTKFVDFWNQ